MIIEKPTRAIGQVWRHTSNNVTNDWQIVAGDKIKGWTINQIKDGAQTTNYSDVCFDLQSWEFVRNDKPIEKKPPRAIGQEWKSGGETWRIVDQDCSQSQAVKWKLQNKFTFICWIYADSVLTGDQWEFVLAGQPVFRPSKPPIGWKQYCPTSEIHKKRKEVRLMIENLKFKDVVVHAITSSMLSGEMAGLFGYEIREDGGRKLLFRPGKLVSGIPVSELTTLFKKEIEDGNIAVTEFAIRTGLLAEARVEAII